MTRNTIIGHDRPKSILSEALRRSQIPHAYLFYGPDSIGKRKTALTFAQAVLCEQKVHGTNALVGKNETPSNSTDGGTTVDSPIDQQRAKPSTGKGESPCGQCKSCLSIASDTHPDVRIVEPEGTQIKIEQIRTVQEALGFKPLAGNRKITIIDDADLMNPQSANCFLKTLEEPPDNSLLILISSQRHRLLSTIISRCQQIRFDPPTRAKIAELLFQHRGTSKKEANIFAALCMGRIGDIFTLDLGNLKANRDRTLDLLSTEALSDLNRLIGNAQTYASDMENFKVTLDWILIWLRDILIYQKHPDPELLINIDRQKELSLFSAHLSSSSVLKMMGLLMAFQQASHRNLNRTMVLETILFEFRDRYQGIPQ